MTKKEIKLIKDTISSFDEYLSNPELSKGTSHDGIVDLTARKDALEWLLEATGNL